MTDNPPTPPNPDDEIDLEALIGNVLEARGYTADRAAKIDTLDALGDNLGQKIQAMFDANKTAASSGAAQPFDAESFMGRIGGMIDAKLAALNLPTAPSEGGKKVPLLQRLMGVKAS